MKLKAAIYTNKTISLTIFLKYIDKKNKNILNKK